MIMSAKWNPGGVTAAVGKTGGICIGQKAVEGRSQAMTPANAGHPVRQLMLHRFPQRTPHRTPGTGITTTRTGTTTTRTTTTLCAG